MEKASLISNKPISSIFKPAFSRALSVDGTGPYPIISGSTPANANVINLAFGDTPSSLALLSLARSAAVAPSFKPAAFPAVTLP